MAEHWGGLYRNIYPKICARVRGDWDGFNLLTFAIVFPVPGGFAEHNLFSQPALIWFFKIMESGARLLNVKNVKMDDTTSATSPEQNGYRPWWLSVVLQ